MIFLWARIRGTGFLKSGAIAAESILKMMVRKTAPKEICERIVESVSNVRIKRNDRNEVANRT